MFRPYYAREINLADTFNRPSTVKTTTNRSFTFWERALFERAKYPILLNLPDYWQGRIKDFIWYILLRRGFMGVTYTAELGTIIQPCDIYGYDLYYQPTNGRIANPAIKKTLEFTIGKDGALLKLTPDYCGIWDIIDRYAGMLSELDNAINMSLINSKFAWLLGAKNKGAASALRKAFDQIQRGEPLAIFDQRIADDATSKSEPFQYLDFNVKGNYITTDLLADMNTILQNFDAEIGIASVPYEKKERLVTDEANSRKEASIARATMWVDSINESAKDIMEIFPDCKISAKLRSEESEDNVNSNNDSTGALQIRA